MAQHTSKSDTGVLGASFALVMPVKSFDVKLPLNISHWICYNELRSRVEGDAPCLNYLYRPHLISEEAEKWRDISQWNCQEVDVMFQ